MNKQNTSVPRRTFQQCLFTTTPAAAQSSLGFAAKSGTLPSQRSLAPRFQAANTRQSSVGRNQIQFRTSQGIKMSAMGQNGMEGADFNKNANPAKFNQFGQSAPNMAGNATQMNEQIEGASKMFQNQVEMNSSQQNKYFESNFNAFQGNSLVKKEQLFKTDRKELQAKGNMPSTMDQIRGISLASRAEHVNKVSKEWIDKMSSVVENQFQVMGSKSSEWNKKMDESFMDKSIQINADTILENVRLVINQIKEKPVLQELNKKLIMAMVAFQTASMANPAYADDISAQQLQGPVSYSQFLDGIRQGLIERVRVEPDGRTADFINIEGFKGKVQLFNDPDFLKILQDNNVDLYVMNVQNNQDAQFFQIFQSFIIPSLILTALFLFTRRSSSIGMPGGMNPFDMGKSKARVQMVPDTGINFDQVAGVDEAKEELKEIVDFLKTPEKFTNLGAKVPRGALLIGPPGTGKTLLAKAVAGEAGVPFFSISASEFVEMFVGVGASRVRNLFEDAKKNAPCIIFIDELDSVGRQRNQGMGMGNDEREQTINQLLTEMDGFEGNSGVIVLAATNIPEVLDKALLRPGRFDRQITVTLPDAKGRTKILGVHAQGKPLDSDVDLSEIAKRCLGMSGADLQNVLNEAAILSARRKKTSISSADIYDSIDRIQIGLEKKGTSFSDKRQKLVAYHEGGHALLGALMADYDLVNKISIVPRGGAGGVTIFTPEEEAMESGMYSKEYLENRICVALGGRIAEEIINGKDQVTTGASNDFQQCTNTAKMMVEQMGMSDEIGPRNVQAPGGSMYGGQSGSVQGSVIREKIDSEVDRILNEQYERGMKLLTENRDALDAIAKCLIEEEKIDGKQLLQLIKSINPDLISEKAMAAIDKVVTPTGQPTPAPQEAA